MVSDNMLSHSVTLNLPNVKIDEFLNKIHDNLINIIMPNLIKQVKTSNIHLFNVESSEDDLEISFSVSLNYEKDVRFE
jgi:hypothetical protein